MTEGDSGFAFETIRDSDANYMTAWELARMLPDMQAYIVPV